eukprot:1190484-Prorocentrum_minimum.AAC.4
MKFDATCHPQKVPPVRRILARAGFGPPPLVPKTSGNTDDRVWKSSATICRLSMYHIILAGFTTGGNRGFTGETRPDNR